MIGIFILRATIFVSANQAGRISVPDKEIIERKDPALTPLLQKSNIYITYQILDRRQKAENRRQRTEDKGFLASDGSTELAEVFWISVSRHITIRVSAP